MDIDVPGATYILKHIVVDDDLALTDAGGQGWT
jgi:hypothetical protein